MTSTPSDASDCAARLRIAVTTLSRRLRPAPEGGISVAKLSVIGRLYRAGAMTPTELAAREGVKLQSLTRLLAELEADGWLGRKAHASDGRQSLLSLTATGRKRLVSTVRAGDVSLAKVIETTLNESDRAVLMRACALLEGIVESLDGEASGTSPAAAPGKSGGRHA
ncbi:MarR family transcriptional regulator [Variovorax sp. J2P1-59]|uniref:MarR family winged helix-turn-helix transcriptional regulator n=1 Tax=Variovorax flavidus TaxID=3053501 RepID=UPI002574F2C6|nr:MarR family transcriptional regulator [Variovorax sp. J2P1-59]MDM0073823.1 MarR family transcriptional regulator [Variovorax sp. J2P1-59]